MQGDAVEPASGCKGYERVTGLVDKCHQMAVTGPEGFIHDEHERQGRRGPAGDQVGAPGRASRIPSPHAAPDPAGLS